MKKAATATLFLGSGAFAVPVLEALAGHGSVDLRAVVTAPPRPSGRRGGLRATPVADAAAGLGLRVLTPARLRDPETIGELAALGADLIVLADYGRLVPPAVLDLPVHGALNLHPSLLPRHRGASPVPAAILAGDDESGVTLMRMDAGLDTGPVVAQVRVPLRGDEVAPELEARLAVAAAELLARTLDPYLAGRIGSLPQSSEGATLTRPLRREDGRLDPGRPAAALERQVRAYQPWPGSFVDLGDERLVVWRAAVAPAPADPGPTAPPTGGRPGPGAVEAMPRGPGTLVPWDRGLALVTAEGFLVLRDVQPSGGRRMTGEEVRRGRLRALPVRVAGSPAAVPGEPG